ncbi:iron complex transport system ATP-binding protein [Winogradskyella wandonensis]|uniref:Iron complex transport system ATP-binding protein n=1 Tax=Winogradskyella wandonensis TaxID=1442586 RepID=A0A4R1KUT4_9FLAO|nr:ABC transporter ATP-binding protein [Winogradskyella wandonensis]TCK68938.1 iron complex transport system ATP-binding protein [Winogradskyella wandonensis]
MKTESKHIILKAEQLSIGYKTKRKDVVIASDINFDLEKGQLIGLVGENGIGKSTLLRTLIKVQPELSGSISLNNQDLKQTSAHQLATQLSIVLTEQLTSKNLSVFELVALGRHPYTNWIGNLTEIDFEKINQALDLVGVTDLKEKKCFELSDGQLQKVMIARALAQDTDLIILDEPTTHLDMYHKAYILKLLKRLTQDTGKTILFSSHEINLAIQLCDTMIVMTKEVTVTDQPCHLIEKGVFYSLFPEDMIAFDSKTGSFRVTK